MGLYAECPEALGDDNPVARMYGNFYHHCIRLIAPWVDIDVQGSPTGPPELLCLPHSELIPGVMAVYKARRTAWINDDTTGGRAAALPALRRGVDVFRFSRSWSKSPSEQITTFLRSYQGDVGLFSDAGKRDSSVRPTAPLLAAKSGRPLRPVRAIASAHFLVDNQVVPVPGARITIIYGTAHSVAAGDDMAAIAQSVRHELLQLAGISAQ